MAPFSEGQVPLFQLDNSELLLPQYKPLSDRDVDDVFGQFDLLEPLEPVARHADDAQSTVDFRVNQDDTISTVDFDCDSLSDEDSLIPQTDNSKVVARSPLNLVHNAARVGLGLTLLTGTIYLGVLIYQRGLTSLMVSFETVSVGWQLLMFTLGFYFVSLPFGWGYIVFNMLAGYMHGFWVGQAIVVVTAFVGTLFGTLTLRYLGRDYVRKILDQNANMRAISAVVNGPNAFYIIALTRMSPFPFGLQTALFSVSDVGLGLYMAATTIGLLPLQALNTYMGTSMHNIQDVVAGHKQMDAWTYAIFAGQLAAGVLVTIGVLYATKVQLHKAVQDAANLEMRAAL